MTKRATVRMPPTISRKVKAVLMMRSALSSSPSPRAMVDRVAPPVEQRLAKAPIRVIRGKQTPSPVRASVPTSSMWPMYIRSTML